MNWKEKDRTLKLTIKLLDLNFKRQNESHKNNALTDKRFLS